MREFLTPKHIAKFEHVTRTTAARWAREGKFLGARRVGREYRIPIESYHKWREETKIERVDMNVRTLKRPNGRTNVQEDTQNEKK